MLIAIEFLKPAFEQVLYFLFTALIFLISGSRIFIVLLFILDFLFINISWSD